MKQPSRNAYILVHLWRKKKFYILQVHALMHRAV